MKKHTKTLRVKVLFSLVCIVMLQCGVFLGVILLNQTIQKLNSSTSETFKNTVEVNASALEKKLIEWENIEEYENAVQATVKNLAEKQKLSVSEYVQAQSNRKKILNEVTDTVLGSMRGMGTTGSFVILDNPEGNEEKDALIFRDLDPSNNSSENKDVLVESGSSELMFERGLTLDSYWSEKLSLNSSSDFYHLPFKAGNKYSEINSENLGYFSGIFRLRSNDIQIMTYTRPLLDENHHSYGVIGIDITLSYLEAILNERSIGIDEGGSYYVGVKTGENTYRTVAVQESKYRSLFPVGKEITLHDNDGFYYVYANDKRTDFEMTLYQCQLYNTNTPFENDVWVIGGMIKTATIYESSNQLIAALSVAIIISVCICLLGAIIIATTITKPIKVLLSGIEQDNTHELKLPRTQMKEIDDLAGEIEKRTLEVYKTGSKVADIIRMTDLNLGVLEFVGHSEKIFCTEKVIQMFELSLEGWKDNYVSEKGNLDEIQQIFKHLYHEEEEEENIYHYKKKNGVKCWVNVREVNESDRHLYVFLDVTKSVKEKQKIKHDRDFDILTNLYNRRAFARIVSKMIENKECTTGVLSIWDLDHLKYINDTYGHDMGDKYICRLAQILSDAPSSDYIAARMAGDEFMAFFYNDDLEKMFQYTKDIHQKFLEQTLELPDGNIVSVSVSAGMAALNQDASSYKQLLKYADFAMYEVKNSNKGNIKRFNAESYLQNCLLVQGVEELNRIINEEAVRYAFQPIVDVKTKEVFAYEALMRPISESIKNPEILLKIAEKQSRLGAIEHLSWFCSMKTFFAKKEHSNKVKLFINSIPNQCLQKNEFEKIETLFSPYFDQIVVEVTENTKVDEKLEEIKYNWCKKHGISLALDDFGSGYSNTDMLISTQFKYVKLDISLIRDIHLHPDIQTLIGGVINYCHTNGQRVIAEGIENFNELQEVIRLGTDFVQGYYLAKPSLEELDVSFYEKFQKKER